MQNIKLLMIYNENLWDSDTSAVTTFSISKKISTASGTTPKQRLSSQNRSDKQTKKYIFTVVIDRPQCFPKLFCFRFKYNSEKKNISKYWDSAVTNYTISKIIKGILVFSDDTATLRLLKYSLQKFERSSEIYIII